MTIRTTLTAMLCMATASAVNATEPAVIAPVEEQTALATYTAPLETMFGIVEKINAQLISVQDEDTAETAGEAIQLLVKSLDTAAVEFGQLPAPTPAVQAELDAWFSAREHIMEAMVQQVERLQNEDPAFFGSQTLISAIVMVGGVLGGAQ